MANTSSAKKKIRVQARRTEVNRKRRSRMRTFIRKLEAVLSGGASGAKSAATVSLFRKAESELARCAAYGIVHRRAASRKISRLSQRLKKQQGGAS